MKTYYGVHNKVGCFEFISEHNKRILFYKSEFRVPEAGEHFLSGAIPAVYFTKNDMSSKYWVMKPFTEEVEKERKASFMANVSNEITKESCKNNLSKEEVLSYMDALVKQISKL